jgi:hypothetical protein
MDKTIEQRIVVAAPSQLRQMAREGMASHVPDEAAQTTGPGSGDGGTTTSPPAGISLQTEMDPKRVREAARKLREQRR